MSGSSKLFAAPFWHPIPACPLGGAVSGPVQSNDMRYLWWWTATEIAYFDLALSVWSPVFLWDGANIICVSQFYNNRVLMTTTDTYFVRTFSAGGELTVYNLITTNGNDTVYNSLYGSYAFTYRTFAYDLDMPGYAIFCVNDISGESKTALIALDVTNAAILSGIAGIQVGITTEPSIVPGGVMGCANNLPVSANPPLAFGYYSVSGGNGSPYIRLGGMSYSDYIFYHPNFGNYSAFYGIPPNGRQYNFPFAWWCLGPITTYPGLSDFDLNLPLIARQGLGGWAGPNSLLLIDSTTGAGNPKTFTYVEAVRGLLNGTGTFETPITVSYNPCGDAPIQMAGWKNQVFVGQQNSASWYSLSLAMGETRKYNTLNYTFKRKG